jgi:hypothetical protein
MAKEIVEVIKKSRMCCQLEDLILKHGVTLNSMRLYTRKDYPPFMWCKHCGQKHEYYRYTDAAGSTDWDYRPVKDK